VNGDTVRVSISEWLTRRLTAHASASYTRGVSTAQSYVQSYVSGNAQLDWQIGSHLLFSTQYAYISQNDSRLLATVPNVARYTVTTGFQFFVSSLSPGRRNRPLGRLLQR
jgi:hypothetical protein